jgi:Cu-processing system ATP-binding protein
VIHYTGVTRRFGSTPAVDRLDAHVRRGEVTALLGPNGSGKTTTLKMAAGLVRPDAGTITIGDAGAPAWTPAARAQLSYLPQRVAFPEALTGDEVVEFYRRLRGVPAGRGPLVLRFAGLNGAGARAVATYSGGMVQRLGLAVALLPETDALLLDEPTAALDPEGAAAFHAAIERRRREGRTVFFTSHQVADVDRLADRILVLVKGRLVADLTREQLRARLDAGGVMRLRLRDPGAAAEQIRQTGRTATVAGDELVVAGPAAERAAVLEIARAAGGEILGLAAEGGRLDALYLGLVERSSKEDS